MDRQSNTSTIEKDYTGSTIHLFDHGHVTLDDFMGSDLSIVNNARVSFAKKSDFLNDADIGVLNYLMKNQHGTPFEAPVFRFNVRCPIFVAREWFRHRISSFNEESLRYSPARLDGYIPEISDVRTQVGKPGAYVFEPVSEELALDFITDVCASYESAFETYTKWVDAGVARELARIVLPVGLYTEFMWTVNARSLLNFLKLRSDSTAQFEIRMYSQAVESFFELCLPITYLAFIDNNRMVP